MKRLHTDKIIGFGNVDFEKKGDSLYEMTKKFYQKKGATFYIIKNTEGNWEEKFGNLKQFSSRIDTIIKHLEESLKASGNKL